MFISVWLNWNGNITSLRPYIVSLTCLRKRLPTMMWNWERGLLLLPHIKKITRCSILHNWTPVIVCPGTCSVCTKSLCMLVTRGWVLSIFVDVPCFYLYVYMYTSIVNAWIIPRLLIRLVSSFPSRSRDQRKLIENRCLHGKYGRTRRWRKSRSLA